MSILGASGLDRTDIDPQFLAQLDFEKERRRREREHAATGPYATFRRTYRHAPWRFAQDCVRWEDGEAPTPYQIDAWHELIDHRRICKRGPRSTGKTAWMAITVLWFALTRDGEPWKIITTASAWRQLDVYLWPEVHLWAARLRWDVIGRPPFDPRRELYKLGLELQTGAASAVASNKADLTEGAHARQLLYLFDEAKTVPGPMFDAAEGALAQGGKDAQTEAYIAAWSTPGDTSGRFYEIHTDRRKYPDWHVGRITLKEVLDAGLTSGQWVKARRHQWGEKSALFQNHVLGEFAANAEQGLIPIQWIDDAVERWHGHMRTLAATLGFDHPEERLEDLRRKYRKTGAPTIRAMLAHEIRRLERSLPGKGVVMSDRECEQWIEEQVCVALATGEVDGYPFIGMGVDVASGDGDGHDLSVMALQFGPVILPLRKSRTLDTMALAAEVQRVMERYHAVYRRRRLKSKRNPLPPVPSFRGIVELNGIGLGTFQRLREEGAPGVIGFNAAAKAHGRDASGEFSFFNKRSQAWWGLREQLDPGNDPDLALPPDDDLYGDLATPRARIVAGARIRIDAKDEIKKRRNGRSTDSGDAVVICCWRPPERLIERDEASAALGEYTQASDVPAFGATRYDQTASYRHVEVEL